MTSSKCDQYIGEIINAPSLVSQIETDNPYTDVFTRDKSNGIYECKNGFDIRYERRANSDEGRGRYPTLVDFRNLFTAGIDYGKRRALGIRAQWDASFSDKIGGYPKGSIVYNSNGTQYISRIDNNKIQIPSDGIGNAAWTLKRPRPVYVGNNVNTRDIHNPNAIKTSIAFIELETSLILQPVTTKLRIASFTGSDLYADFNGGRFECSGMVLFSNTICWELPEYAIRYRRRAHIAEGMDFDWEANTHPEFYYSLKLSPYQDFLTNSNHSEDFIELASITRVEWDDNKYPIPRACDFKSPVKAVPIRKDKKYYLFLEYVNGRMYPMDRLFSVPDKIYLEVYPYTLGMRMPSST